jgi:CRISPR-associated endonuclease/helicase Cas3
MLKPLSKKIPPKVGVDTISYKLCPAKTHSRIGGGIVPGRSVLNHCQIVGETARALVKRWPEAQRQLFPENAFFAAASHDIGKVSPTFYEKILSNCSASEHSLQRLNGIDPNIEKAWGGHAGVSQLTAKKLTAPKYVPEILGQHHGFSPGLTGMRANDEIFGGATWQKEREHLVDNLKQALGGDWPIITSVAQARLVAGLTTVADWIGSGQFYEDPSSPWEHSIEKAIDAAGFIPPTYTRGLSFHDVFGFSPRLSQEGLIGQVTEPGIYILEAPMGMGKTEAALYCAYRMLETGQASGVYFALPTQLTSNKIFERFNEFLDAILDSDCKHRSLLLHGGAWLLDTDMGEDGRPGGAWFNSAKRGLLAPFAVGTVDQALMAAMNVKHGFVRAFGLAGKVVILDEIHTYDSYTGTLLDALVKLLRELGCTVIILSATLNQDRRSQILGCDLVAKDYPLITAAAASRPVVELAIPALDSHKFDILIQNSDDHAVDEALARAASGQQVLWIENTVASAQERYLDLASQAAASGIESGLLHSRLTPFDRQRTEDRWVTLFGKAGRKERGQCGRILVGTQVLEQSLDIDADFLITRFAPTDMLLQRFGRLWRHDDTYRPVGSTREAWLLAPDLAHAISSPEIAFGASAFVYSPYVLCRSLEIWRDRSNIDLPADIRALVEDTYVARSESGQMQRWLSELENGTRQRKGRNALRQLAQITLATAGRTLPESKAQTRYSEQESVDVLLVRRITSAPNQSATSITLLTGEKVVLPHKRQTINRKEWRDLSALLIKQCISVRIHEAPDTISLKALTQLGFHHCFYLGDPDRDEAILRIAVVSETGELRGISGEQIHSKRDLDYRSDLGYRTTKK